MRAFGNARKQAGSIAQRELDKDMPRHIGLRESDNCTRKDVQDGRIGVAIEGEA
jgi:hypothetical protein